MSWNHRVVRRYKSDVPEHMKKFCNADCSYLEIAEVYYDENGKPNGVTEGASAVLGGGDPDDTDEEVMKGLRWQLEHMLIALDKPILDEKADFPEEVDG
jgi:hypothetical protein